MQMQGAVFDLDGVITDTAKYHFAAWSKLAKENLDIELPASFETELKGVSRIDSLKKILEYGNKLDQFSDDDIQELAATTWKRSKAYQKMTFYQESLN